MKLALAFLLLGICLVPANANYGQKMTEHQGNSHGRMFTQCMQRWIDIEQCRKCNEIELYCRQKAFLEDVCFLLKLLAQDLRLSITELVGKLNCGVHISFIIYAVQNENVEQLTLQLRNNKAWNLFYKQFCRFLNSILYELKVDLGRIIASVNACSGKKLEIAFGPIQDVVSVIHIIGNTGGGKAKPGNILGGLVSSVSNIAGGVVSAAGGLTGGVIDVAGGVVGGAVNNVVNVAGNTLNKAGNLAGGLVGNVVNLGNDVVDTVRDLADVAGNLAGGALSGRHTGDYGKAGHGNSDYGSRGNAGSAHYSKGNPFSPR